MCFQDTVLSVKQDLRGPEKTTRPLSRAPILKLRRTDRKSIPKNVHPSNRHRSQPLKGLIGKPRNQRQERAKEMDKNSKPIA
jgi:hypothetical protein